MAEDGTNDPMAEGMNPTSGDLGDGASPDADAEAMLAAAREAIAGLTGDAGGISDAPTGASVPAAAPGPAPSAFALPSFAGPGPSADPRGIDLLSDVNLHVKIELGRTRMYVEDVLKLGEGSVVELDKLAGDPVDLYVNERLIARGEVLVLNDNFCVRINEIIAPGSEAADGRSAA